LREALAVQLEQSPFLRILDEEQARQDLPLTGHDPGERITNDIAQEICVRHGKKATVGGFIESVGGTYAIALQATDCQSGRTLARQQIQAADKQHVLGAVSTAVAEMRAKLGESRSSIQKLNRPLDQAATSLEAFQAYSLGREQVSQSLEQEAIPSLQHAIEVDPNFASAYELIGQVYASAGDVKGTREFKTKAFGLIDHASEIDRFYISEEYYRTVTGNLGKDIETSQSWARTYPRDSRAHMSLGIAYSNQAAFGKALREFQEAASRLAPAVMRESPRLTGS
jgi:tetratricopeptide (TPR) repeat protein